ncbi:MAG: 50S ribosomal protein L35 [Fibrobacteraceae bacterium]|nr:50S ribosomal protein L35 [Fibrobacteraceae bacterium]
MPKMKTHSGSKKRFRLTGSGHVKYKHAGMRHILAKMNTKRKRNLRKGGLVKKVDLYHVKRLLVVA